MENGPVTFLNLDENSDEQYLIPAVTAKEGYKFVGWQGYGASEITWGADAKTFGVTGLCHFAEGETEGHASLEAKFEKVETPVVKKTAHVTFTVDSEKGSFTEYGTNPVKFDSDEDNDQQFVIPEVTAKEGYKFVGWKGNGAGDITWGADAKTFGVTGLCFYNEGATDGYASIEAVFEKEETPETKRTSNVYFTVDSEKGSFTEYGEGPVTFLNLDENSDEQYSIPAVTAKEGYKFVGWKGQGADEISWGADAKTFGVTGLCAFAEGATEGYASLEAQFEKVETPVVKKTAHVTFTVDSEKGSFTEYGTNPVKFDSDEDNDQQFEIPEVTAKEGYKFVGWKGQGADEITWGADAKTFGVTGLCFYNEDATDGYASIEAVFEKEETPETKRTSNVYFTVDSEKGSFTEYGEGPVTFLNLDENSDEQYSIPAVTAKEGYKFVGWKGQGADEISWGADAKTFGVTGLCHFAEGETEGYASLEAVFEKEETPETKRTSNVYFTVNPEYGSFTEYGEGPVTFLNLDENSDEQYLIPAVTAKEGYKFVGWKGQGADAIEWDADAKTFGVTGLCHFAEGETEGYASLEAVFEKEETPETKRTSNVYFTVNPEYGSFTEYGEGPVTFLNLDENSDEQYLIPAVTAKEGYKFVGWKGQGADAIEWDADAKTFGVTGLCHFAEGETEGYASLEAVFEKVDTPAKEDNKKDDSKKDDSKKEDSKKDDSKKDDSKKADSKKEDNKVSTGAATGLFGSLAGVTAAGASLVALLRKKNSK